MSSLIGTTIRQARIKAGLSQAELAKRIGFATNASISNLERGTQNASVDTLLKIAKACNANPADLITAMNQGDDHAA